MVDDPDVLPPETAVEPEEEGGGPVKTFLEHLEDLRWTLIKCVVAIFIGFIACLSGAQFVIRFLTWPLEQAQKMRTSAEPRVVLLLGTNILSRLPAKDVALEGLATNRDTIFRIEPRFVGTNIFLAMAVETNPPPSATYSTKVDLLTLGPIAAFSILMQVAVYGGIVVSAPFVMFFIGQFVLPALHMHEKQFLFKAAGFATFLFFLGVAFCYFLLLIVCISTTVTFSEWLGFRADQWRAEEYISFVTWFMLGMGLAFELPLVLLTLVKIGILNARRLSKLRMYFAVGGLVLAAFITPDANPVTMFLLFLPLHMLYEISVAIAWFWERKARRRDVLVESSGT